MNEMKDIIEPSRKVDTHYTSGEYWSERQDSDSTYKVFLFESLLSKSGISLEKGIKAAEIGCGQGAFLFPLANYLNEKNIDFKLSGFDISPQAIALAKIRNSCSEEKLSFHEGSAEAISEGLDFIFCMDVLEHVENPFETLRQLYGKSKYLVIHLPLEHSFGHLLFNLPSKSYESFKHIHFYSWETAKILINESPFSLLNYQFTAASKRSLSLSGNLFTCVFRNIRYLFYRFSPEMAVVFGGGSVLLLLKS